MQLQDTNITQSDQHTTITYGESRLPNGLFSLVRDRFTVYNKCLYKNWKNALIRCYLRDFLSACLVLFLSLGAVLGDGPFVAVLTRLSSISSSPSVKFPLILVFRNDLFPSLRVLRHGKVPCKLSTSDISLPSNCRSSASALSSFVLNFPTYNKCFSLDSSRYCVSSYYVM